MTDVQQAVPVAQEAAIGDRVRIRDDVRRFGGRIGTLERFHEESVSQCPIELRLDDGLAYCFRQNELEVLPLPCKSGEGAGEIGDFVMVPRKLTDDMLEAVVKLDFTSTHDPLWPEYWAAMLDAAPTVPDATQTREAELVAALTKAHLFTVLVIAFLGRDRGTPRQEGMLDDVKNQAVDLDSILRAALNGRDTV